MAEFAKTDEPFVVKLCKAIGLSADGLVSFRLSAGEDGTPIPRIRAEYVLGHDFGQAAEKVVREFSLSAIPASTLEAGTVDRSVSLMTRAETIHRPACSQAPHCSGTTPASPSTGSTPLKG